MGVLEGCESHITARPLRGPSHPQSRGAAFPVPGDTPVRDRAGLGTRGAGSTGNSAPRGERLWDTGLHSAAGCSPGILPFPFTPRVPTCPAAVSHRAAFLGQEGTGRCVTRSLPRPRLGLGSTLQLARR